MQCKVVVRFMTLEGKFDVARTESFDTTKAATDAVRAYAEAAGYTNVKLVDDGEEPDAPRFTATTPGGRRGRNVAFADFVVDEDEF